MKKSRLKRLLAALLGRGSEKNNGDVWHKCPFCKHSKSKLSINIISEKWHCWHCNAKGRKLFSLLRKLNANTKQIAQRLKHHQRHQQLAESKYYQRSFHAKEHH